MNTGRESTRSADWRPVRQDFRPLATEKGSSNAAPSWLAAAAHQIDEAIPRARNHSQSRVRSFLPARFIAAASGRSC